MRTTPPAESRKVEEYCEQVTNNLRLRIDQLEKENALLRAKPPTTPPASYP